MCPKPLLEARNIDKSFGGVHALRGVSLSVAKGEVHALCGENGAGKSTLNRIISGSLKPDSREDPEAGVFVDGRPMETGYVAAAEAAGIAILHQESTAFPHLNAEDNIFVGRELRKVGGLLIDRVAMRRRTAELLERLGEDLDPRVPLRELTVAQRQMVGIARALSRSCRLLIMDEPTASLSARETRALFDIVRQLRADGVSVLYVSHRLEEVFELADRVTVLRDGERVGTWPVAEVNRASLIRAMVGRAMDEQPAAAEASRAPTDSKGEPSLEVKGLSSRGVFRDITFSIRPGEIVSLAGLVGAGRSEVARAIFGIDRPDAGEVRVGGEVLEPGDPRKAIAAGVSFVPEDRQHQGLILPMSVGENLTLAVLRRLTRRGLLSSARQRHFAREQMDALSVRAEGSEVAVETLSGGNQQKVLLGKWLAPRPRVLILDEPTRGVDVGAKAEVHRIVRELVRPAAGGPGIAVLMISSELPEVLQMSDRILVMREGALAGELDAAEASQDTVLDLALPDACEGRATAEAEAVSPGAPAPNHRLSVARLLERREFGVLLLLLGMVAVVAAVNPVFLSFGNVRDMLVRCAPVVIVACGVTLVVLTREIDISVGSMMGLLAAVLGILVSTDRLGLPVAVGATAVLAGGAVVGLANGLLVAVGRVPSIIVTLGMLTALRGVTEVAMGGEWITGLPPELRFLGTGSWFGIPVAVWTAGAVVVVSIVLTRRTPLGRRIRALGSNPRAAALAGLSPLRLRLFVFAWTGLLTGLATLVSVPQLSVIESGIGIGFELLVVTCVIVGGTSIAGGRGTVAGSVLGVLLLATVPTVLIFLKLGEMATYWERAIQGAFILAAVLADHVAARGRRKGGAA